MVVAAVGVAAVAGSAVAANQKKKAAQGAANAQVSADQAGIAQQEKRDAEMKALMQPYVDAGTGALRGQQDFLGLNGQEAQSSAVNGIANSEQFRSLAQQGENAILQNASATGGLRGGNTQGALAQFRPQLLNGLIDQQYQRLGGLTTLGQNSAAGVGTAGINVGNNITGLLQSQGQAQAGYALAKGNANAQLATSTAGAFGRAFGGF